jgi:hypothetical protein
MLSHLHQKYAELRASGTDAGTAYATAYNKTSITPAVLGAARRLDTDPRIKAKIAELRQRANEESEAAAVLNIIEKRKFLAEILRTPVTELDPEQSKGKHHLIRKVTRKMIGTGENAIEITEVEGYDKIKAITTDNELEGDAAPTGFQALAQIFSGISTAGAVKPIDRM